MFENVFATSLVQTSPFCCFSKFQVNSQFPRISLSCHPDYKTLQL